MNKTPKIHSARKRFTLRFPPAPTAKASEYVRLLDGLKFWSEDQLRVWLHLRVSSRSQKRRRVAQVLSSLSELTKRNISVCGISWEIGSGWKANDRVSLLQALKQAMSTGAVLVAESTCRLIRSELFDTKWMPDEQPSTLEMEWLSSVSRGLTLATIFHPNTPNCIIRSHQTKRGMHWLSKFPGKKKAVREAVEPHVLALLTEGWSLRRISRRLMLNESTLRGWQAVRGFFAPPSEKRSQG